MHCTLARSQTIPIALTCSFVLLANSLALANDDPTNTPAVLYGLGERSTFQQGCFDPCDCLLQQEQPIRGTYRLKRTGSDADGFDTYHVTDIRWIVLGPDNVTSIPITGHGTYRINHATATGIQQLKLRLDVNGQIMDFDSGLQPGGYQFPAIDITVTVNNYVCFDTVIHIVSKPIADPPPRPRKALFVLHPDRSELRLSLFSGGTSGKLLGSLRLYIGDPNVPVIALAGMTGVSVRSAYLVAPELEPDLPGVQEPLVLKLDPRQKSLGAYNYLTGEIGFELFLVTCNGGSLVPMPIHLRGTLTNAGLEVKGNNGDDIADANLGLTIVAHEVDYPYPFKDLWFSTEVGFGAAAISPWSNATTPITDGDLLSRRGHIVRRNRALTANLGIMPIVPDLGLDALTLARPGQLWFSFEESNAQIWSETLGRWLKHGDLLSTRGYVVATNERLLSKFVRMPVVTDAGLDAVTRTPHRAIWFSTEESFFSEALGVRVNHGDLLSNRGRIVRTNAQLLENFDIVDLTLGPLPPEYGLDTVILRPNREIWFSTELGFYVADENSTSLRWISDGALLSTHGYVVADNLELVSRFEPVEDVDNFGLDAADLVRPVRICDFNFDDVVDASDLASFNTLCVGPVTTCDDPEMGDFDGDDDADIADLAIVQQSLSVEGALTDEAEEE